VDPHAMQARRADLMSAVTIALPELYLGNVPKLVSFCEFKVALETLLDHFTDQNDNRVPASLHPEVIALAQTLNVDRGDWEDLIAR
jgi:hypothetical protein